MKFQHIAIGLAAMGLLATPAMAGKVQELGTGGNTISGPSKVSMDGSETRSVVQGLDQIGNPKICVTVQVSAKSGDVQLDLVENNTVSVVVPSGGATTLCGDADRVDLTCMSGGCSVIWRADRIS